MANFITPESLKNIFTLYTPLLFKEVYPDKDIINPFILSEAIPIEEEETDELEELGIDSVEDKYLGDPTEMIDNITSDPPLYRASSRIDSIIQLARQQVGKRYVRGALNPNTGFDCSGLVHYVYAQHGITTPRHSTDFIRAGKPVDKNDIQPGDVICYDYGRGRGHVKIVSKIVNGTIYTIEAKGKRWGVVEGPLRSFNKVTAIRRFI